MTSYYFVGTMALVDNILQLANAMNTLFQAKHVYIKFAMDEVKKNIKMLQDMLVSGGLGRLAGSGCIKKSRRRRMPQLQRAQSGTRLSSTKV